MTTAVLPIDAVLPDIQSALQTHNRAVLVAQPGAGKTTRVPLALLKHAQPGQRWLLLEPRRVAARLAASYMAEQLGESVGQTVGYRVRGESRVSVATKLEVLTQGILTRMMQDDPELSGVAGLIFDEFHERSLDADTGLALALDIQQGLRNDLKILVMSATLDTRALLTMLGDQTPLIDCPGRSWPVTTFYRSAPLRESADTHLAGIVREALAAHDGHVLVFLPGQGEIRRLEQLLRSTLNTNIDLCPLHGQMPLAAQQQVLKPSTDARRRIILSTAIAESSVTVPGVRIVIDAGRERVPVYQPRTGLSRLDTRRVNRASADQRRGRAGREADGFCYRAWSEESVLATHREPEMLQSDLSQLVFELTRWGVTEPGSLNWIDAPPAAAVMAGRQLLRVLGLIQSDNTLTALGKHCGRWPTHPRLAVMLEQARRHPQRLALACWLAAWLEEQPGTGEIDLGILLGARDKHQHHRWHQSARQWAQRLDCSLDIHPQTLNDDLAHLLLDAYPDRLAITQGDGQFKLISGGQASVPGTSSLVGADFIVAVDLDAQATQARIFSAAALSRSHLEQHFPSTQTWQDHAYWDDRLGRLVAEQTRLLALGDHELVLERKAQNKGTAGLPPERVRHALLTAIKSRGNLNWSDDDLQLLGRLRLLHRILSPTESIWPDVSPPALMLTLEHWLGPHLSGLHRLDQIDRLPLAHLFLESLDWRVQQALPELAPTHIKVPSGSAIKIDYSGDEPVLAVKLQEMFGQTQTPTLVGGRVPLLIHLLSPARRPVQITRDLAGFWSSSYFEVRKDLRGRYPKHPWPEDPLLAVATARAKPRN
ncbi:ATP-dependent helicase HrpB [Gammaproteobacteria bacterium LSUCC0112]|nr:ATP-dependent helicase HrpB [Gammaproteobacteria bacterium LSUCC0112]